MKPPTSEDITRKLQHGHFSQRAAQVSPTDPDCDTPMVVTLEQLRPYEHNPRFIRNPLYEELKASIRDRGLDQPPSITRRAGEAHFIIRNGGNTRLTILGELWQETREERFFRIHCLFRPWQSELHTLLGHLAESDLHGQLTFIERALAVAKFRDMLLVDGSSLSQRELAAQLSAGGYPISQSHISRMLDTLEHLLPAIPQTLYAGLGKPLIERTLSLRRRAESVWNRYVATPLDFAALWLQVLSTFDCTTAELDTAELQDDLLAHMAKSLDQSPRLLALELIQDSGQASRQPLTPDMSLPPPLSVGEDTDSTSGREPEAPTGVHSPELVCPLQPADRQPNQADQTKPPAAAREQVDSPTAPPPAQSANLGNAGLQFLPDSLDTIWPISPALEDLVQLRQACAQLASELAGYAKAPHMVCATEEGLGFSLAPDTAAPSTPHRTGIQLLLGALLRVQDDVAWEQRQQLPAALFGQLLLGVYDLPLIERPALAVGIERLPDPQLAQLFSLIRLSRRLIELTLSSTR